MLGFLVHILSRAEIKDMICVNIVGSLTAVLVDASHWLIIVFTSTPCNKAHGHPTEIYDARVIRSRTLDYV